MRPVQVVPVGGMPEVRRGDELTRLIAEALGRMAYRPMKGDIVSVSQKVVSKAEGAMVDLRTLEPSALALVWGRMAHRDARHVELILRETRRPVRVDLPRGIFIMETHQGFVCANAGVDRSNAGGRWLATVLPRDPDRSARRLRDGLAKRFRPGPGILVVDTFGRAWRKGLVDVVLGAAGVGLLDDQRGRKDRSGYLLKATVLAQGDALAAASQLVKGKLEGIPVALVRGYIGGMDEGAGRDLIRAAEEDLFR